MFRRRSQSPDHRQTLQEFSRSLALIVDEDELHQVMAARLREAFGIDSVAVFVRDGDGSPFRLVSARGLDQGRAEGIAFASEGKLARWLRVNETPFVLAESPGVVEFLDDGERTALEQLGTAACYPLIAMNRLSGFLALGSVAGSGRFGLDAASREVLGALMGQMALAIENAALLREQRARIKRMYRAERLATAGELAAGAAHEVRNPLASIRSAIQYLRSDYPEGSERIELIDEILAEADRIDGIVEGLLSFARPHEARFEPVDLAELIRQSATLIAVRARDQQVRLVVETPEALPLVADTNLLKQLLLNILLNALQAMPDGGDLRITGAARARWVEVRVADTGRGIPAEHIERIFDPFFTTKKEGTGLGLSICYGIVERHGGELEVESEAGRGTTMIVGLPEKAGR